MSLNVTDAVGGFTGDINRLADSYTRNHLDLARGQERVGAVRDCGNLLLGSFSSSCFFRIARPLRAIQRYIDRLIEKQSGSASSVPTGAAGNELEQMVP